MLDDLDEEFREIYQRRGGAAARRWARRQAFRSLSPLLRRRLMPEQSRRVALHTPFIPRPRARPMTAVLQDLRYALRSLLSSPGYSAVVVLVLTLGIGANTAVFSLVNPFLFRALPYEDPDRLVHVFETDPSMGSLGWDMQRQSWPTIRAWEDQSNALETLGAYNYGAAAVARPGSSPAQLTVGNVTVNLFHMLGVEPLAGRLFAPGENEPGGNDVLLIHESLWRGRYGADPDLPGGTLMVDGREHVVVGIMPASFNFPFGSVRLWKPLAVAGEGDWNWTGLLTVGKLAPGAELDTARRELETVQRRLEERHPELFEGRGVRVIPIKHALVFFYEQLRGLMLLLLLSAGFVLLIVCANVGNLAVARATRQRREIAIRAALGADRARILRQLVLESLLLALPAAAAGALLGKAAIGSMAAMVPAEIWRVGEISVDGAAYGYTAGLALLAAVAFGVLPGRRAADLELTPALRRGRGASQGGRSRRLTRTLVAAQVAVATVLCGGALMTVAALQELREVDMGFEPEGVVTASLRLPAGDYPGGAEIRGFLDRFTARVAAVPGVEHVALIDLLPMDFAANSREYRVPGRAAASDRERLNASWHRVDPGYFDALEIPILRGRTFSEADGPEAEPVAVINQSLASRRWPEGAVGETVELVDGQEVTEARIVGVVADTVGGFVMNGIQEQIYQPLAQAPSRSVFLLAAGSGDPAEPVPAIRSELQRLDPALPLGDVRTLEAVAAGATAPLLVASQVLGSFGGFALLLAAIGVYGLVAYAVAQRTRELGVRMALGARPGDIYRLVLRSGGLLAGIGALVGGGLTWGVQAVVVSLTGVGSASVLIPLAVVVLLSAVAGTATWIPARRATRIDPLVALRAD